MGYIIMAMSVGVMGLHMDYLVHMKMLDLSNTSLSFYADVIGKRSVPLRIIVIYVMLP